MGVMRGPALGKHLQPSLSHAEEGGSCCAALFWLTLLDSAYTSAEQIGNQCVKPTQSW